MTDAAPAQLPHWLSEEYANLRTVGVLDLFRSIGDATAVSLAPRVRAHGGLTKLAVALETLGALEAVSLRSGAFTGAGVAKFAALAEMESLGVQGDGASDACVDALIGIGSLRSVGLGKTKVSKRGVTRLRAARPDLHVST